MSQEYLFVSCDIVAHSSELNIQIQKDRIVSLNAIIGNMLLKTNSKKVVWASGGDGGHLCFPEDVNLELTIELIIKLRLWGNEAGIRVRIIACTGPVEITIGADERIQLVGHGINQAGRLLDYGGASRVVITAGFYEKVKEILPKGVKVHDKHAVKLKSFGVQEVFLLSVEDTFISTWHESPDISDRLLAKQALLCHDFLEVIYRARRLLQINAEDTEATNALRMLALNKTQPSLGNTFINDLFLDAEFGPEFIYAASLIERKKGEIVCEFEDEGETMFFILKGQIGVYLPKDEQKKMNTVGPDFLMSPGELAGEIAFALRRRRTATLYCIQDTALLAFSYNKVMRSFAESAVKNQMIEILNRKILTRILENFWNTAPYLIKVSKFSSLSGLMAPWLTLLPYCRIVSLPWSSSVLRTDDMIFKGIILGVLVSGRMETNTERGLIEGADYPIVFENFITDNNNSVEEFYLETDVKIITMQKEGFFKLDRSIYREVAMQVRAGYKHQKSSFSKNEIPREKTPEGDKKKVFLSYCHDNFPEVLKLREKLIEKGLKVWWDRDILPGKDWKFEIRVAMKQSAVIILCLSHELQNRIQSGVYPEVLDAIAAYREYSQGSIFLIPVRLSECTIPPIEIDSTRTLDRLQYLDLFPFSSFEQQIEKLVQSIATS
jgi:hypothetical protein